MSQFEALYFPGKSFTQPRIGFLDLMAVVDALPKHAVSITYAVAEDGQRQRRAAIEKTGREAAEATVAQAGIVFVRGNVFFVQA